MLGRIILQQPGGRWTDHVSLQVIDGTLLVGTDALCGAEAVPITEALANDVITCRNINAVAAQPAYGAGFPHFLVVGIRVLADLVRVGIVIETGDARG